MNILITGIHGFVGSNLVMALKSRHTPVSYTHLIFDFALFDGVRNNKGSCDTMHFYTHYYAGTFWWHFMVFIYFDWHLFDDSFY